MPFDAPRVWVLADPRPGTAAQAIAVAEALEWPYTGIAVAYRPLAALPNALLGPTLSGLGHDTRADIVPPWPDMVIAAGRRTAPIARAIKRRAAVRTGSPGPFIVQIMYPGRFGLSEFDLVAVPNHDHAPHRENMIFHAGAPHRLTRAVLDAARAAWEPRWRHLPRPWTGLLVGGATRRRPFTERMAEELAAATARLVGSGGSLLVSTSRRTGAAQAAVLRQCLEAGGAAPVVFHEWGAADENPYHGIVACADRLVVTGDSVSMCSEACAAGVPVGIFAPPGYLSQRHSRMLAEFYRMGLAAPLDGGEMPDGPTPRLDPASDIAAEIKRRFSR